MAINFPLNPSNLDTFVANDVTYSYNGTKGYWETQNMAAALTGYTGSTGTIGYTGSQGATGYTGSGGASTLGALTDVTLTTPVTGNVLSYNGSVWANAAPAGGGGSLVKIATATGSSWSFSQSIDTSVYNKYMIILNNVRTSYGTPLRMDNTWGTTTGMPFNNDVTVLSNPGNPPTITYTSVDGRIVNALTLGISGRIFMTYPKGTITSTNQYSSLHSELYYYDSNNNKHVYQTTQADNNHSYTYGACNYMSIYAEAAGSCSGTLTLYGITE